jgi:formate transporter
VAAGFEHSVANMYVIPLGLLIQNWSGELFPAVAVAAPNPALSWTVLVWNLVPVTLGNMVGGGVLVGGVYWFVYLRGQQP